MEIGCDIEENNRFKGKTLETDERFLRRIFSKNELDYCLNRIKSHENLCARFCAKEAYIKASNNKHIKLNEIETLNDIDGAPYMLVKGAKIDGSVSISHTKTTSIAVVLLNNVKK